MREAFNPVGAVYNRLEMTGTDLTHSGLLSCRRGFKPLSALSIIDVVNAYFPVGAVSNRAYRVRLRKS